MEGMEAMSGTRRTPLSRPSRRTFTPEALAAFRKLRNHRGCTCKPIDWEGKYWERDEWDVTLGDGATYRVFRERDTDAWFIEGVVD